MGDSYRPSEDHNRNQNRNRNRRNNGGGSRNRSNRGPRKNSNRRPAPPKKKTLLQKILGFFGIGKKSTGKSTPRKQGSSAKGKPRKPREHKTIEITSGRLFVGNLDYGVTDESLAAHFQSAGEVKSAEVVTNPHTNKSKGFAFVEMESIEQAKKAAELLNDKELNGRKIAITGAKSDGRKTGGNRGDSPKKSGRPDRRQRSENRNEKGSSRTGRSRDGGGQRKKAAGDAGTYEAVKPIEIEQVSGPGLTISNLSDDFSADDLADLFEGVGTVASNEISGGTGTITMASTEDAQKAIEVLHAKTFMGKKLSVKGNEASENPEPAAAEVDSAN